MIDRNRDCLNLLLVIFKITAFHFIQAHLQAVIGPPTVQVASLGLNSCSMVYAKRSLAKIDVSLTITEQCCWLVRFLLLGFFFFLFFCLIHAIVGVRNA